MKKIIIVLLGFAVISCTKGAKSPDGLIIMFAKDISTKNLDKEYYEKFTTGEMWDQINEMGDDEFEKNSRMANVTDVKVEILSKTCEKDRCAVTYRVEYKTKNTDEGKFDSEVKKIAEVHQDGEFWKVAKITTLKTFHESSKAINPLTEDVPKSE